ncbi:MAG: helix-turn-helix domain-containing protein [Egibacteraceae bacterium]
MANERLRAAMAATHVSVDELARAAEVDPKTVQRWLAGRIPHARHRWAVATRLAEDESYLYDKASADCLRRCCWSGLTTTTTRTRRAPTR